MLNEHQKKLVKMIQGLGEKYSTWSVFNDFLTMAATAISNAVDPVHREEREKLYMEAIAHYRKDEQSVFPEMFTVLVQAADQAMAMEGPKDILGAVFHDLELHNKYKGQFFTPQSIADMMAQISGVQEPPEGKDYIRLCEPTCGSGVMVISAAKVLLKEKKARLRTWWRWRATWTLNAPVWHISSYHFTASRQWSNTRILLHVKSFPAGTRQYTCGTDGFCGNA